MNHIRKYRMCRAVAIPGSLALSLALAACGSGASSTASSGTTPSTSAASSTASASGKGSITIGFSPFNQSAQALIGLGKAATSYLGSKGDKVLVADPNNDSATQIQQIDSWVQNGQVQGVWLLALDTAAMKQVLQTAESKGVVMVANGTPAQYGLSGLQPGLSFDNIDYNAYGSDVGTSLGQCLNSRFGGAGQVIILTPTPGEAEATAVGPFTTALAATDPKAQIVARTAEGGDILTSQQHTASALQAHPAANAVVSFHDEGTDGAIVAFQQAGKNPAKECLVNAGGSSQNLADVTNGSLYAVVALQFASDMTQTADLLIKMAADPKAMGTQLLTPIKIVKK